MKTIHTTDILISNMEYAPVKLGELNKILKKSSFDYVGKRGRWTATRNL